MKTIKIILLCIISSWSYSQQRLNKTSQSIKVKKDVAVELNTSYVEIELDTWNKDVVEVEAYIESIKLSNEQLKEVLASWNLKIDATTDAVVISSTGGQMPGLFVSRDYSNQLKDLEWRLAEIPEMPPMPALAELPEMPPMPAIPALPELPKGLNSVKFNYDRYQKEGEKYLEEWSRAYEDRGGKELEKNMAEWAKRFEDSDYQKKMEAWGKEYAKRFEGKWAKDMEKWGEEFGEKYAKEMEQWGDTFGEKLGVDWAKKMEVWGEQFGKQMEERAKIMEERSDERSKLFEERHEKFRDRQQELSDRREALLAKDHGSSKSNQVKKVIKLKIPKKAKLKMNVRYGELKISTVLHNLRGDISHSFFMAENLDGGLTSINVSYTPLQINKWNQGALNLNFVDNAHIISANNLVLNSKSSNVLITDLADTAIIDGSFGELTILNLANTFKNLNLVLENSDSSITLPKNLFYTVYFKGSNSRLNKKETKQKTIRTYPEGQSSDRNIVVNAKYSDVIMN